MKINNLFIVIGLSFLLSACSEPRTPEDIVAERAQARWDAMVARNFETAWEYYTPGFKEKTEASSFRTRMDQRPIRWDAVRVTQVECAEENKCQVSALITYSAVGAPGVLADMQVERNNVETWIQIAGQWWYTT